MQMPSRRPLIAGNWKMHGLRASVAQLESILRGCGRVRGDVDLMVCPPTTLIAAFAAAAKDSRVAIGGQDCHAEPSGAYTGDISAEMLADAGAGAVIVGHSERRTFHRETDADVRGKAHAARRAALVAIVCIGETQAERAAGQTLAVVERQLAGSVPDRAQPANLVIAYEPVWAIGTGLTPTATDIEEVHGMIRERLATRFDASSEEIRVLYGGSVKPENARELLAIRGVDGALVGGASLKAEDFLAIAAVYA
jgi:triosephosphate isomerase (TIM)